MRHCFARAADADATIRAFLRRYAMPYAMNNINELLPMPFTLITPRFIDKAIRQDAAITPALFSRDDTPPRHAAMPARDAR